MTYIKPLTDVATMDEFKQVLMNNPGLVVAQFSATWCVSWDARFERIPGNVQIVLFDDTPRSEVYGALAAKGVVTGIPSLVMYRQGNLHVFAPDDTLNGAKVTAVDAFFQRILDAIVIR